MSDAEKVTEKVTKSGYRIGELMQKFPCDKYANKPTLKDLQDFGGLTQLCGAVLDKEVPEPWVSAVFEQVPSGAWIATIGARMLDLKYGKATE